MTDTTEEKYAPRPDAFPDKGESGSGHTFGYSVQARYAYPDPLVLGDVILTNDWKTIHFNRTADGRGVPERNEWHQDPARYNLHSWEAAQALRYWFIAEAALARSGAICLETRIVTHTIDYSYSVVAVAATAGQDFRGGEKPAAAPRPEQAK